MQVADKKPFVSYSNIKSPLFRRKLNLLFVHVQEEKILSARYGIRSIPVQVFFAKNETEVFRHTGFFPEAELEKKIAQFQLP